MRNIFGNNVQISVFGESHGPYVGMTIDGLSAGLKVSDASIQQCLSLRRPSSINETARVENDDYEIISGVFNGFTTGAPLTILVKNQNVRSQDYEKNKDLPRPSHADYVAHEKYVGFEDYRGGGHFSGRVTAALVAGGAIVLDALEKLGIRIGTHIKQVGKVKDRSFENVDAELDHVIRMPNPVLTEDIWDKMVNEITDARNANDSVGGIIETAITGLPVGLGSPMFDSLEGDISKAMFAIGAIKGVEFGDGFSFAGERGSEANDSFRMKDGNVETTTNRNGGINGGISNGMPVIFSVAVKPTPSISQPQDTVNLKTKENDTLTITGRHDPAIIRRINIVIRCMTAFVIADALETRYGENVLREGF